MYSHSLHAQQAQKQDQYKKILMPVIIGSTCLTAIAALVGTIWFIKKRQDRYRPIHSIQSKNNSQKQQQESWSHIEDDELSQVAHIYIMHPAQSPDVATVHSLECSISCIYNTNQPPIQWEKPEERRYVESLCRQQRPVALLAIQIKMYSRSLVTTHVQQIRGMGSSLMPLLYKQARKLAGKSGNSFFTRND